MERIVKPKMRKREDGKISSRSKADDGAVF